MGAMLGGDCTWAPESRLRRVLLGLLLLAIGASAGAAEAPAADPVTHLVGTVLDASGKPAAGAMVGILATLDVRLEQSRLAKSGRARPLGVKADAAGRFDFALPRSFGTVTVVARRAGFLSAKSASIPLKAARQDVPALKLSEGLKFTGRVLDEQRRPIPAATVQAVAERSRSDTTGGVSQTVRGQTQRDGSFELAGLDVGGVTLAAYSRSHVLWTKAGHQLDASAGSRRLEIVLKKGVYLAGRVLDVQGQPISGVTVSTSEFGSLTGAKSDASGGFRLGPFQAGQSQGIDARLAGYTPFREFFTAPRTGLVVVLNRNAVLRGRVVDGSSNQPVPSFRVSVHSPKGDQGELQHGNPPTRTFNSRDGRFELPDLYTGPWTITVLARGYQSWERADFEFLGGVTHDLAITLNKGLTLHGRVIDKARGKPLPGARVSYELKPYHLSGFSPPPLAATSDATGTFIIEGVPPGLVTIRASVPGYREAIEKVDAAAQTFVELAAVRGAVVRGRVVAVDGVTPVLAAVSLNSPKGGHGRPTDSQGRFEFTQQEAGSYLLEARTKTARSEVQEVTVSDGQDLADLVLRLNPAATLRGRLSGVAVVELATAKVYATRSGVERFDQMFTLPSSGEHSAAIEAGGAYRMQGLGGGAKLVVARSRFSSIAKKVEVPERSETTLDFDFGDVQVSGRVTRDGRPAPGVRVFAKPLEGQLVFALATTTATGEYSLSNLGRGRYAVGVYDAIGVDDTKRVEIQVGRGVVQNFELDAEFEISGRAVDAATRQGLAEVTVQLAPLAPDGSDINLYGSLITNRQGEFTQSQVTLGDYSVVLYRAGYDIAEQRVSVSSSVTGLVMELRAAEGASLQVRTADKQPIAAVDVSEKVSEQPTDRRGIRLRVRLDQYGLARLPPALAGRTLRIQHPGYATHLVERWNGGPLDIELRRVETPSR